MDKLHNKLQVTSREKAELRLISTTLNDRRSVSKSRRQPFVRLCENPLCAFVVKKSTYSFIFNFQLNNKIL